MFKTIGIINGLLNTEKQRCIAKRTLGGKSILEWITRQTTDSCRLSRVVVVTDDSEENAFIPMLTSLDVPVCISSANDTMSAVADTLAEFDAEACILLGMDWPLIDSSIIDRIIYEAEKEKRCEYAAFVFNSNGDIKGRPYGMFPEWYLARAFHAADRKAKDPLYREFPGYYFLEQIHFNRIKRILVPSQLDRSDIRLAVETEEDWDNLVKLFYGIDQKNIDWRQICNLLKFNHELRSEMSICNNSMTFDKLVMRH